tara:strand:- start:206 stop:748 length:543 start_codon:yes stop_codon:yes gene_type:complete
VNSNNYIKKYNVPNLISVSRLIISVYFFFYIDYSNIYYLNLILYISLIGLSDAIDGYLARKYDAITRLGTIIDPFVDRTVFILLLFWLKPLFTDIFFWGILIRDGLVLLGSLLILNRTKTIQVSNLGKFTTVLLFITICIHVLNLNIGIDNIVIFMSYTSLFLYYYVALEYLYKQVLFSK